MAKNKCLSLRGKDREKIWSYAKTILSHGTENGAIQDNMLYKVSGLTPYGELEILGKTVNETIYIGTIYLKHNGGGKCLIMKISHALQAIIHRVIKAKK
jgi:hypothetical protein